MKIKQLHIENFRAYGSYHWEPIVDRDLHLLHGPNGCGKTTILEALYLMVGGRSFRTSRLKEIFHCNPQGQLSDNFSVQVVYENLGVEKTLWLNYNSTKYRLQENGKSLSSLSQLLGKFQAVILSPQDIELIQGVPTDRRKYIDLLLSQTDPEYLELLVRYHQALAHRNQLIKQQEFSTLSTWSWQLAMLGGAIIHKRLNAIEQLNKIIERCGPLLSVRGGAFHLNYTTLTRGKNVEELGTNLYAQLQSLYEKELATGYTLAGPHKEDWLLFHNGRQMSIYSSEGEQRLGSILLKLCAWSYIKHITQVPPILLMDDIALSLDPAHAQKLLDLLASLNTQCIITSPSPYHWNFPEESTQIYSMEYPS